MHPGRRGTVRGRVEDLQQLADAVRLLDGMTEVLLRVEFVPVSTPRPNPSHVPSIHEVSDDALHGTFADADSLRQFTDPDVAVAKDAQQHVPVIRHEGPVGSHQHLLT